MLNKFKARIETTMPQPLKNGDIFISQPNCDRQDIIPLGHETFTFSKEDIIFSKKQSAYYQDFIRLAPFDTPVFADGTKYQLHRIHDRGKTKYLIEVDGLKVKLKLNWLNRQIIEWVHGRKINWVTWQVTIAACLLIATVISIYINITKKEPILKPQILMMPSLAPHIDSTIQEKRTIPIKRK